ncbi:MAG TPA: hypothetical protein VHX42_00520, partial [Candidatus Babeliales bacterium]|nr:hypothetical protein [Candidatus Babeliales bacterium]
TIASLLFTYSTHTKQMTRPTTPTTKQPNIPPIPEKKPQPKPVIQQPIQQPIQPPIQKPYSAEASKGRQIQPTKPTIPRPVEKPVEKPKTIEPQKITQEKKTAQPSLAKPSLIYNAILLLDPKKVETLDRYGNAMVGDALMGFYEQVAPIIMTTNILEIIMTIRQKIGDYNFQQLRNSSFNNIQPFAQQLAQKYNIHEAPLQLILMSLINFDKHSYYLHKSDNLVLVIPHQYIKSNMPNALKANALDQAEACGFNPNILAPLAHSNPDYLLHQLKSKSVNKDQFVNHLTQLFIPQEEDRRLLSPTQNSPWIMYISGHGGPTYLIKNNQYHIMPEAGNVAGVSLQEFAQLMKFFDASLNVEYIHYTTCFSGGYSQSFVNDTLSSLDVDFIVSSEGLGEQETSGIPLGMQFSSVPPYIQVQYHPFTDFFKQLRALINNPEELSKVKGGKKGPLEPVLRALNPTQKETNQPFVRFPEKGIFRPISTGKNTEILTSTIVKQHEKKHQPINYSNMDIGIVVIDLPRVDVPLIFGNNTDCGIVTPTVMTTFKETVRVFNEISWNIQLQTLLFNFVRFNPKMDTQLFVVKKLNGILSQQSQLPSSKNNEINNLIIKIDGMMGTGPNASANPAVQTKLVTSNDIPLTKLGVNVNVVFEWNGKIYYYYAAAIKTFHDLKEVLKSMQQIPFASTTVDNVAHKFLTSQEINQLKKPLTLEDMANFIDNKINIQEAAAKSKK